MQLLWMQLLLLLSPRNSLAKPVLVLSMRLLTVVVCPMPSIQRKATNVGLTVTRSGKTRHI